jgi:hypothetical protein
VRPPPRALRRGAAEACGVVDRDKPSNIMLECDAAGALVVKVIDYGVAKSWPLKRNAAPSKPKRASLARLPLPARSNSPALDKHGSTRAPISTPLALPFGICSLVVCPLLGAPSKKFARDKRSQYLLNS